MAQMDARVQAYLDAIVHLCSANETALVSVILFGSAATGGFSGTVSDVDLIIVVPDDASPAARRHLRTAILQLEADHGIRDASAPKPGMLESIVNKITVNARPFFLCTRAALLSGSPARILDVPPAQAVFVDRAVIASIILSAITVWGEELLAQVPLPPIRRFDVCKSCFSLSSQVILAAAVFPLFPKATRIAMSTLKHAAHNCFFCFHGRPSPLEEEVAFFAARFGPSPTLTRLFALRQAYQPSFPFIVRCLPAVIRLHLRTAAAASFPLQPQIERESKAT